MIPPKPLCACITVIKVKCAECGKEYVVYDSRYYGYSGVFHSDSAEREYEPHFRQKKRRDGMPAELYISVEHAESYEELNRQIPCSGKEYADAFTWIVIYAVDANDKKRKLFEFETD